MGEGRERIVSLQILRFVAAAAVVADHASCAARSAQSGSCPFVFASEMLGAGVDVFFVLSGLVITLTGPLAIERPSGGLFFWRRWSRVAPIYFILSLPMVASAIVHRTFTWPAAVSTFLFWPAADHGFSDPFLTSGWTLCFEMVFYSMVALVLAGGRWWRNAAIVGLVLGAVIVARAFTTWEPISFLTSPLFLEFGFGVGLAMALTRLRRAPIWCGLALLALGAGAFILEAAFIGAPADRFISVDVYGLTRVVLFGLPATAMVAGACICERAVGGRLAHALAWLGDSSYSLYLSHGLAVPLITTLGLVILGGNLTATMLATFAICILLGAIVYVIVERPILRDLRRIRPGPSRRPLAEPAGAP